MPMTMRERILAVYQGTTPDVVPFMLDLSHWFYHRFRQPWDLSVSYEKPEYALIDYHKQHGVGFYLPNLGSFFSTRYGADVQADVRKEVRNGVPEITWRLATPLGAIERTRIWEEESYSWGIRRWSIESESHLRILAYALASRTYEPLWERWHAWDRYVGDLGVVYASVGYSAMGHLLNYWMGTVNTMYALSDWPDTMREVVDQINDNTLKLVDLLAESPAQIIIMGDNISSAIQPPHIWKRWSAPFYREAIRRLHAAGKFVAVHIDGMLRGALAMVREAGADCADAVTPKPMHDLTPLECRQEAGPDFILSGGVPPNLWQPDVDVRVFERSVLEWLELRRLSPRLIANAGDQVPPGAEESRITLMRDLVEEYGRY